MAINTRLRVPVLCLTSFKVSDCPSRIHPRRDPRVWFSEKVTSRSSSSTKIRNIPKYCLHLETETGGEIRSSWMPRD